MKSLIVCFAALLLIIATPLAFSAIDNAKTDTSTETFAGVTTAAGVYSANVTIARAIYNNDTTSFTEITSNVSVDSPSASAYNSVSRLLTVSGLDDSQTRTLSIDYMIDNPSLDTGVSAFFSLWRWFWIFAITGMVGGAIYAFFQT